MLASSRDTNTKTTCSTGWHSQLAWPLKTGEANTKCLPYEKESLIIWFLFNHTVPDDHEIRCNISGQIIATSHFSSPQKVAEVPGNLLFQMKYIYIYLNIYIYIYIYIYTIYVYIYIHTRYPHAKKSSLRLGGVWQWFESLESGSASHCCRFLHFERWGVDGLDKAVDFCDTKTLVG